MQLIDADTGEIIHENYWLSFVTDEETNYLLRVTTYYEGDIGNYSLTINSLEPPNLEEVVQILDIQNSASIENELNLEDFTDPIRNDLYKDDYILTNILSDQIIDINFSSEDFTPYLQLINQETGEIIEESSYYYWENLIFIPNPEIDYVLRVTNYFESEIGNYSLRINAFDQLDTGEEAQTLNIENEFITYNQLNSEDGNNPTRNGSYKDDYLLTNTSLLTEQLIIIHSDSEDFNPYLQLIDANTGEVIEESYWLSFTPKEEISYLLRITSQDSAETGIYSLTTNVFGAANGEEIVETLFLEDNLIINGELNSEDRNNPTRNRSYKDDYQLTNISANQLVTFSLDSNEFYPYLQLINQETGEIIQEDDYYNNYNSRGNAGLTLIPDEGINYLLRVTSNYSEETGNYTLTSDVFGNAEAEIGIINIQEQPTLNGELSQDSANNPSKYRSYKNDYLLNNISANQLIILDLASDEFNIEGQLIDQETGELIEANVYYDNRGNLRLSFIVNEDINYVLRVTSNSEEEK